MKINDQHLPPITAGQKRTTLITRKSRSGVTHFVAVKNLADGSRTIPAPAWNAHTHGNKQHMSKKQRVRSRRSAMCIMEC